MIKEPIDSVGNNLYEGNWVAVKSGSEMLIGKITKMDLGGIEVPGKGMSAGRLTVGIEITYAFAPGASIPLMVRIVSPEAEAKVDKLYKEATANKPKLV